MTSVYYSGYRITELRRYAREYKIPGRSKMDGYALLAAVRKVWEDTTIAFEKAVLTAGPVVPGVLLRFFTHPGCVIKVTSNMMTTHYGTLYVHGEYVTLCETCAQNHPAGVSYMNDSQARRVANGYAPDMFMLWLLNHAEPTKVAA